MLHLSSNDTHINNVLKFCWNDFLGRKVVEAPSLYTSLSAH